MDSIADIEAIILDFWKSAASNSLQMETGERAWAEPHVAIAAGDGSTGSPRTVSKRNL